MDWLDVVLDKLKSVDQLVDNLRDEGADVLRDIATLLENLTEAARKSADAIDPTPAISAAQAKDGRKKLEALKKKFEDRMSAPGAKAFDWSLLIPVIIRLIDEIIKRRFPNP